VRTMFGGRCAYCGRNLPEKWHVDHVEPVIRAPVEGSYRNGSYLLRPERERADNYMPACPPCNIDKSSMSVETWRKWLRVRQEAIAKTPGFRLLAAHGLIQAISKDIRFHFEEAGRQALADGGKR
jgi:hypothetical protein